MRNTNCSNIWASRKPKAPATNADSIVIGLRLADLEARHQVSEGTSPDVTSWAWKEYCGGPLLIVECSDLLIKHARALETDSSEEPEWIAKYVSKDEHTCGIRALLNTRILIRRDPSNLVQALLMHIGTYDWARLVLNLSLAPARSYPVACSHSCSESPGYCLAPVAN